LDPICATAVEYLLWLNAAERRTSAYWGVGQAIRQG
jgi:hypothetical protein